MSVEGSLVTWHWGEDIVTHIKNASGLDTQIVALDDLKMGIRAEYIEVLVTTRPIEARYLEAGSRFMHSVFIRSM